MNLSLFDSNYFTHVANRCEVYHFHIYIEGNLMMPFGDNDAHMKGVFMHEYIHYIQHLSTLCGVMLSRFHNLLFCYYRTYFSNYEEIPLPLRWRRVCPDMENFFYSFNKTKGDREYDNRVDKIRVNQDEINAARREGRSVNLDTYNEEVDEWTEKRLSFGYYAIIESMADMVQRIYEEDVNHDVVPYMVVQKLCESYYPVVASDNKMMIAICTCALMSSNPGVGFFDVIEFAKEHPNLNGAQLYNAYVNDSIVTFKKKNPTTIASLFEHQFIEYDATLEQALGVADYYREAFESSLECAQSGHNPLLNMLYDESISPDNYFNELKIIYGTPYIEAYNNSFYPGRENMPIDVVAAIGLEILFKCITNEDSTNCPRLESCIRLEINSYDCINGNQWFRSVACPFKAAMHYFRLEGKSISYKR